MTRREGQKRLPDLYPERGAAAGGSGRSKGYAEEEERCITGARGNGYQMVGDAWRRAGVTPAVLARLSEGHPCRYSRATWTAKASLSLPSTSAR